jgi:hypothetical protein
MSSTEDLVRLSREIRNIYETGNYPSDDAARQHVRTMDKYKPITEKYPPMLNIICSKNYDRERLEFMIRLAAKVHSGEVEEKVASVAVGQRLVDEIVKPQIEKNKK